jgi:hypothetical protein
MSINTKPLSICIVREERRTEDVSGRQFVVGAPDFDTAIDTPKHSHPESKLL